MRTCEVEVYLDVYVEEEEGNREWEEERARVEAAVQQASADLDAASAAVASAVGRLSDLDAAARQAEALRRACAT